MTTDQLDRTEPVTLEEMLATGATYRQLDYWERVGYFAEPGAPHNQPGSGYKRRWTHRERMIAALIVRLLGAGLRVGYAARMARDGIDLHVNRVTTDDGVMIAWTP